jgi:proline dehydrogenase
MIPGLDRLKTLAGRAYVAPRLEDALAIAARWGPRACASLGYRNVKGEDPGRIARAYREAIDAAARSGTCRVSVKLPPLGFEAALIAGIVRKAADEQVRLHVDAMGHESADATFAAIARATLGAPIGVTLPGRWRRSRHDAALAVSMEWPVRVVKGEWVDPTAPDLDPALGFLAVVDALAGRARHVSVATHDEPLARESLRRLIDRHTPCVLELLHGLPLEGPMAVARSLDVPVRLYVLYGQPALPYALSLRAPDGRMLARGVRDLVRGRYHWRKCERADSRW